MRDWVLKSTKEVKSVNVFTGMGSHQKSKSFATMSKMPSNNLSLNLSNMHNHDPIETEVRDPFSTFEPSIKQR